MLFPYAVVGSVAIAFALEALDRLFALTRSMAFEIAFPALTGWTVLPVVALAIRRLLILNIYNILPRLFAVTEFVIGVWRLIVAIGRDSNKCFQTLHRMIEAREYHSAFFLRSAFFHADKHTRPSEHNL